KILYEKVNSYCQLLIEKDRLIEQLVNENTRFQDQLNLLSTNITEKETVIDALKKLNTRIDIIEKSSMTSTTYSQIVKKTYATKSKEIPLKSIVIIPSQQQTSLKTRKDLDKNLNFKSKLTTNEPLEERQQHDEEPISDYDDSDADPNYEPSVSPRRKKIKFSDFDDVSLAPLKNRQPLKKVNENVNANCRVSQERPDKQEKHPLLLSCHNNCRQKCSSKINAERIDKNEILETQLWRA
ncbi:unnamed protein product, partial [Acanthoscelides obtectus]